MDASLPLPETNPSVLPMSAGQQILLVQESFAGIAPQADLVTDLFFARLFQLDPSRRAALPNDLRALKGQFMYALARAVRDLSPAVTVGDEHSEREETVSSALVWTVEQALGERFTAEVREAWMVMCPQLTARLGMAEDRDR